MQVEVDQTENCRNIKQFLTENNCNGLAMLNNIYTVIHKRKQKTKQKKNKLTLLKQM